MGSWVSSQERLKKQNEDQKRRQYLEVELKKMQRNLNVTATAHYIASEYYSKVHVKLQYASLLAGPIGIAGGLWSKLDWKMMVANSPRVPRIVLFATSAASLLFTVVVNIPEFPNSPGSLHKLHFRSGIECQYLEKEVKFFATSDVWNSDVAWATIDSRYKNFLKDKKEVNSKVQSQRWAYLQALEELDKKEKDKIKRQQKQKF
ncbi:hypothetical protein OS493_016342 [Desmophyllum pertusum]|uniref:Uncharacterized protein n=1 Tax=Desmophyllum pertusum TaxID=174260 RepID=A0A9X0D3K3_9CNID|nr:hypothetical protein OS493_016342 [Desmophyllum pertusum]